MYSVKFLKVFRGVNENGRTAFRYYVWACEYGGQLSAPCSLLRFACEKLWARRTDAVTPLHVGRTVLFWYNGTVQLVS